MGQIGWCIVHKLSSFLLNCILSQPLHRHIRAHQYRRQKKTDETTRGQHSKAARPGSIHGDNVTHLFNLKDIKLPKPKKLSSMRTYRSSAQDTMYTQGNRFRTKEAVATTSSTASMLPVKTSPMLFSAAPEMETLRLWNRTPV